MLTRMGGEGSDSVPAGKTGTGVQGAVLPKSRLAVRADGGIISRPGWPGRWKRRVIEP